MLVLLLGLTFNIGPARAVTLTALDISSVKYNVGDKISNNDPSELEVGKTLQLYALADHGNDIMMDGGAIVALGIIVFVKKNSKIQKM